MGWYISKRKNVCYKAENCTYIALLVVVLFVVIDVIKEGAIYYYPNIIIGSIPKRLQVGFLSFAAENHSWQRPKVSQTKTNKN